MVQVKNMSVKEFKKRIQMEQVVCFGAGQEFSNLCKKYPCLSSRLMYVVDNSKKNGVVRDCEKNIPIISFEQIDSRIKNAIVLVTSIKYAKEIIEQIEKIQICEEINVYIPHFFYNENSFGKISSLGAEVIPRKIHYCWFGGNKLPTQFKRNIETWKKYCPDYEIICWNESNYDYTKSKYMRQAYEAKKWGFVSDYARIDIVNNHGGIYLDTDVELLKPLDSLLQYNMFCGFESSEYVAFGLGFGAKKNHNILREILELYEDLEFLNKDGSLNLTTCPIYQTKVLMSHGLIPNNTCQEYEDFIVFSNEYFAPIDGCGIGFPSENSFSIHQYAATWYEKEAQLELEVIRNDVKDILAIMQ